MALEGAVVVMTSGIERSKIVERRTREREGGGERERACDKQASGAGHW